MEEIVIKFEVDTQIMNSFGDDLYESLCKAIYERNQRALDNLSDMIIGLDEIKTSNNERIHCPKCNSTRLFFEGVYDSEKYDKHLRVCNTAKYFCKDCDFQFEKHRKLIKKTENENCCYEEYELV